MAAPTAAERKKSGIKKGPNKGKYPVGSESRCISAVKLRHNGKGISAAAVLARCAAAAAANNWAGCKAAVAAARKVDSGKKE